MLAGAQVSVSAKSSSQRVLRIVSKCATEDELIAVFSRFSADNDMLFIVTRTPKPVGFSARIKIALAGGEVMIDGDGEVVGSVPAGTDGRPGMVVRLTNLVGESRAILDRMGEVRQRVREARPIDEPTTPGTTLGALVAAHEAMAGIENAAAKEPPPATAAAKEPPLPRLAGDAKRLGTRSEDQTPLPDPMPMTTDSLPALASRPAGSSPKADPVPADGSQVRAQSSSYVLPANPLGELPDGSIEGFVECSLYEEAESDDEPDDQQGAATNGTNGAASHEDVSGFAQTLMAMPALDAAGNGKPRGKAKEAAHSKTLNIAALPKVKPRPRVVKPTGKAPGDNQRPLPGVGATSGEPPPVPGPASALAAAASSPGVLKAPAASTTPPGLFFPASPSPARKQAPIWKQLWERAWRQPPMVRIAAGAAVGILALILVATMTCGDEPSTSTAASTSEEKARPASAEKARPASAEKAPPASAGVSPEPAPVAPPVADEPVAAPAAPIEPPDAAPPTLTQKDPPEPAKAEPKAAATIAAPEVPTGQCEIAVVSRPDNAVVRIDGKRVGKTPLEKALPCGRVEVSVDRARWVGERRRVRLEPGKRTEVRVALSRPQVKLWILSMPPNATVWVRGRRVGKTPIKVDVRAYERSAVKIRKRGYETWRQRIRPTGKKTLKVRLRKR